MSQPAVFSRAKVVCSQSAFALDSYAWPQGGGDNQNRCRCLSWVPSLQFEVSSLLLPGPPLPDQWLFSSVYDPLPSHLEFTLPSLYLILDMPLRLLLTLVLLGILPTPLEENESNNQGLVSFWKRRMLIFFHCSQVITFFFFRRWMK